MNFTEVVTRLRDDWSFVSAFMDNPTIALAGTNLTAEQHTALTSRNAKSLLSLGIRAEQAVSALSGCHRGPSVIVPPTRLGRA